MIYSLKDALKESAGSLMFKSLSFISLTREIGFVKGALY